MFLPVSVIMSAQSQVHTICVSAGKTGLRLTSTIVAICKKQRWRKSCQEDDHWVGETGWTAQRVWTGHWCLAGQSYTGAGNWWDSLGRQPGTIGNAQHCGPDAGQEHLGWWLGGDGTVKVDKWLDLQFADWNQECRSGRFYAVTPGWESFTLG